MKIEIDEIIADHLAAKTPFHIEKNWEFTLENKNTNCSHAEMDHLILKKILTIIDLEILKILVCYHYINSSNLFFLLNDRLHPAYRKENYLTNMNKMMRAGVILRYHLINSSALVTDTSHDETVSPLRVYCISPSAYTYMEHLTDEAHPLSPATTLRKLELSSVCQFLIRFRFHHGSLIKNMYYSKTTRVNTDLFTIDAIIQLTTSHPAFAWNEIITLIIFSVREGESWVKHIISRLTILKIWLQRNQNQYKIPFILLIVEGITMMITIYEQTQSLASLDNLHLYFCPDGLLMAYPPLDAVYTCELDENNNINAIRYSIVI